MWHFTLNLGGLQWSVVTGFEGITQAFFFFLLQTLTVPPSTPSTICRCSQTRLIYAKLHKPSYAKEPCVPGSAPSRPPTCAAPRCQGTLAWSRAGSSGGRRAAAGRPPPAWSGAGGSEAAWGAAAPAGTSGEGSERKTRRSHTIKCFTHRFLSFFFLGWCDASLFLSGFSMKGKISIKIGPLMVV